MRRIDDPRLQRRLLDAIEAAAPVLGFVWNLVDNQVTWMGNAEAASRWSLDEAPDGTAVLAAVHPDEVLDLRRRLRDAFRDPDAVVDLSHTRRHPTKGWRRVRAAGRALHDSHGRPIRLVGAFIDVHHEQAHREQLERRARVDDLTGLLNRVGLVEVLGRTLHRRAQMGAVAGLLLLDLDRFRAINRALGPEAGDTLLCHFADLLTERAPEGATVARVGADQFAIVLPPEGGAAELEALADDLVLRMAKPVQLHRQEVALGVSIGALRLDDRWIDAASAVRDAENALARAKDQGGGCWSPFVADTMPQSDRLSMEARLRHAIDERQFRLAYQPIVQLPMREVVAFEALIRWKEPELGWISPGRFIPLAEECGLILPIGDWVLEEACRTLHDWRCRRPDHVLRMNVNLSAVQFRNGDLVQKLDAILDRFPNARGHLNLELTETALLERPADQAGVLEALRNLGCQLHIDDFGTGWSSLSNLVRLPVDALKVDREFVMRAEEDRKSLAVVRMVARMAQEMGLSLTAEGIETEGQVQLLNALGRCRGQGYLFSRPLFDEEAYEYLVRPTTLLLTRPALREAG